MAERRHEQSGQQPENQSLKEREYRDKEGNVHHHTRTYEEQHKGERHGDGQSSGREHDRSRRDDKDQ